MQDVNYQLIMDEAYDIKEKAMKNCTAPMSRPEQVCVQPDMNAPLVPNINMSYR